MREQNQLLQRQLANALDMDTAMLRKMERGERRAKGEHSPIFASLPKANVKELFTMWRADQVYHLIKEEENATEILKVASKNTYANTKKIK